MPSDVLPDLLRPGLRVVFHGTAAGTASAARGAYHAGPGNRFWPIPAATGRTARRLRPEEFSLLAEHGIGLTDAAKTVSGVGADATLPARASDRRRRLAAMERIRPARLAFNGKRASAVALGLPGARQCCGPLGEPGWPPIVVLPSTSGAASGCWDAAPWFALARFLDRR